jgi:hypothetical protein
MHLKILKSLRKTLQYGTLWNIPNTLKTINDLEHSNSATGLLRARGCRGRWFDSSWLSFWELEGFNYNWEEGYWWLTCFLVWEPYHWLVALTTLLGPVESMRDLFLKFRFVIGPTVVRWWEYWTIVLVSTHPTNQGTKSTYLEEPHNSWAVGYLIWLIKRSILR